MSILEQVEPRVFGADQLAWSVKASFRPLHALMTTPSLLFLATMTLMLFHPPGVSFRAYDRVAFGLLIFGVLLRLCVLRERLRLGGPVTWPMFGLLALALGGVLAQPYSAETWSVVAAKWVTPFALYHLAGYIFDDARELRKFEIFALLVLAYLSGIAILFIVGEKEFIFPRFILDEGLGIHSDRARGPFLQAVANGVALNLLGLLALDSFRRERLRGWLGFLLLTGLPLAILATKTRAVWLSFSASILMLPWFCPNRRLRRCCLGLALAGTLGLMAMLSIADHHRSLSERLEESGPVKFRMAVYQAGWQMFLKKPISGWGTPAMQRELSRRISDFHQEQYYFHNTYLEILVQYGVIGLSLYAWLAVDLFRVGRKQCLCTFSEEGTFLDESFRSIWPLILLVYLVNGSFVVMNYQFVNGLLFALAGMLNAQNRRQAELDAAAS